MRDLRTQGFFAACVCQCAACLWVRSNPLANSVEVTLVCLIAGVVGNVGWVLYGRQQPGEESWITEGELIGAVLGNLLALGVPVIVSFVMGFPPDSPIFHG